MRVIDPKHLYNARSVRAKRALIKRMFLVFLITLLLLGTYSFYTLNRPLPAIRATLITQLNVPAQTVNIVWPSSGQSAVGAVGVGVLASSGAETPRPMASISKVITALAVLKKYPLKIGQQGPIITLDKTDVDYYFDYANKGGSVVAVGEGERLSQYQALQAMLISSGNNIADTLARWAFGSIDNYVKYANDLVLELGLRQTHVADASGFSSESVSTPSDLVRLGIKAMDQPVLAEIVKQPIAQIPVAGTIISTNQVLGKSDIVGIKTGNTDAAGGCFLFAAMHDFGSGNKIIVVGAVMGADNLNNALLGAVRLLPSVFAGFGNRVVGKSGERVGYYKTPWGSQSAIVLGGDISLFGWLGSTIMPKVDLNVIKPPQMFKSHVGSVLVSYKDGSSQTPLFLQNQVNEPTVWWRLTHPF